MIILLLIQYFGQRLLSRKNMHFNINYIVSVPPFCSCFSNYIVSVPPFCTCFSNKCNHRAQCKSVSRKFCQGWGSKNVDFFFFFFFFFCYSHHILQGGEGSVVIFKARHHRRASKTQFQWRFADGLMMASGDGMIFQGAGLEPLSIPLGQRMQWHKEKGMQ